MESAGQVQEQHVHFRVYQILSVSGFELWGNSPWICVWQHGAPPGRWTASGTDLGWWWTGDDPRLTCFHCQAAGWYCSMFHSFSCNLNDALWIVKIWCSCVLICARRVSSSYDFSRWSSPIAVSLCGGCIGMSNKFLQRLSRPHLSCLVSGSNHWCLTLVC